MDSANCTPIDPDVENNTDCIKLTVDIGNHDKTSISLGLGLAKVFSFSLFGMWMIKKLKK